MASSLPNLMERFDRRNRRALAEIISRVENGQMGPPSGLAVRPSRVVGITGSGGAGKSTLIGALVKHLRGIGCTVGVLASDPQSPVSGGALLGDRIRVELDPADEGVYFRSLSTRGAAGGISAATGPALEWMRAFGLDVILVETVGAGQDQVAIRKVVDTLVLLATPATGDEIQWEKAGLIELADVVAVNKSDLPGADRVRQQITQALSLGSGKPIPVVPVSAASGMGVAELWGVIAAIGNDTTGTE
jgi:LAO/AO transport system kinase